MLLAPHSERVVFIVMNIHFLKVGILKALGKLNSTHGLMLNEPSGIQHTHKKQEKNPNNKPNKIPT